MDFNHSGPNDTHFLVAVNSEVLLQDESGSLASYKNTNALPTQVKSTISSFEHCIMLVNFNRYLVYSVMEQHTSSGVGFLA